MTPEENETLFRLEAFAAPVKTRLYQRIQIVPERDHQLLIVRHGTFLVRISLPGDKTLISSILFPGDVYLTASTLPHSVPSLVTGSDAGEIWRLDAAILEHPTIASRDAVRLLTNQMAETAARQTLHTVVVSALTGEERVAALLLDLALRTGSKTEGGVAFEMPLNRTDVADYLALNADTVSRIFSRLRSKMLITTASRNRLICPDIEALARECPLAETVAAAARAVSSA